MNRKERLLWEGDFEQGLGSEGEKQGKPGGRAHQLEGTAVEGGPVIGRSKSVCSGQSEGERWEWGVVLDFVGIIRTGFYCERCGEFKMFQQRRVLI